MKILVINAGSSSLKYQLIDSEGFAVLAKGLCERIGISGRLIHQIPAAGLKKEFEIPLPTHDQAIQAVLSALVSPEHGVVRDVKEIGAVGHRTAHGGEAFSQSVLITDEVLRTLEAYIPLAPLHSPPILNGIRACQKVMPGVPMAAVFDTSFHQTMPERAFLYALPYEYYQNDKVRRYGFHGTSHRYVSMRCAELLGRPIEELKIITCHLGNGSSVTAVDRGRSVDTSMGFTPVAGLPMGTRSGDVDPGILEFLMERHGMDIAQMLNVLNKKSGVLGISGVSPDFRDIGEAAKAGNRRAALALECFRYSVKKLIGAYAAAMGGVDAIVFTAGIGENDPATRMAAVSGLEFMGVEMDSEANLVRGQEAVLSAPGSRVRVLLIPTDEERMIAMDTAALAAGR